MRPVLGSANPMLHLASSSPRRREILHALGIAFTHAGVDIDETPEPAESPEALVLRLAESKARAAAASRGGDLPILAADTIVALDDVPLGKPADEAEALGMLGSLSARSHLVLTAVALMSDGELRSDRSVSEVRFREILPDEARAYWQSGEPADKAGAYAIQGLGGIFVEAVSGSYSGIVGLPVFETAGLLRRAGVELLGLPEVGNRDRD